MAYLDNDGLLYFWQQIKTKFAKASHTHAIADVTGLQTALDSARNTANAAASEANYNRQQNGNVYAGRSIAATFQGEIGSTNIYKWLQSRVRNANFEGLRIGDYIDVPITEGANVPAQTVRYMIGAIDQYYQCGDQATGHHVIMVPRAPVSVKGDKASNGSYLQWRETDDNNGTADEKHPYMVSKLHDWEINDFMQALPADLQAVLMTRRALLEERYSSTTKLSASSYWSWAELGKVWSPSEMEVCGCVIWGTKGYSVGLDSQLPIFSDTAHRTMGTRVNWWLRSVSGVSSAYACCVSGIGNAAYAASTIGWTRPRPCFLIG